MTRRRRIVRAGGVIACSMFALLLWSKLKLVSGIPRTAFATPDAQPSPPRPSPGQPEPKVAGPGERDDGRAIPRDEQSPR